MLWWQAFWGLEVKISENTLTLMAYYEIQTRGLSGFPLRTLVEVVCEILLSWGLWSLWKSTKNACVCFGCLTGCTRARLPCAMSRGLACHQKWHDIVTCHRFAIINLMGPRRAFSVGIPFLGNISTEIKTGPQLNTPLKDHEHSFVIEPGDAKVIQNISSGLSCPWGVEGLLGFVFGILFL